MNLRERAVHLWTNGWGILLIVLVVSSMRSALADWNDVPTGSMKPTILEGDRVIVNKLAYGKATAVAFSFDRANHFKPRFDRFMTALR